MGARREQIAFYQPVLSFKQCVWGERKNKHGMVFDRLSFANYCALRKKKIIRPPLTDADLENDLAGLKGHLAWRKPIHESTRRC